jgi:hypothetical protein
MHKTILVFAGNETQFRDLIDQKNILSGQPPMDPASKKHTVGDTEYIFVSTIEAMRQYKGVGVEFWGAAVDRSDITELKAQALLCKQP